MRIATLTGAALWTTLSATSLTAQEAERYTLEKTPNGYVRMDNRSGKMSFCEERTGQLVCKLAADERAAHGEEVERLQTELEALEKRVAALESAPRTALQNELPDEQTFDQALGLMERFFRRFMGIVKDMERDFNEPEADPTVPQRT